MKIKSLILGFIFCVVFNIFDGFAQLDPVILNPGIAGIHKQIARSVNAENLWKWNFDGKCYGFIPTSSEPYEINSTGEVNCEIPYNRCYSNYCPDKYNEIIQSFVRMKASMVLRSATFSSEAQHATVGSPRHVAMTQMIQDINSAYDQASLRRPVVQAGIFEWINTGVSSLTIPCDIIELFLSEMTAAEKAFYYNAATGQCTGKKFVFSKIAFGTAKGEECPDITKIQARMLYYYFSRLFIDMGFKAIHMGQMKSWAKNDIGYGKTVALLKKIRKHADDNGTFVLLNEENYNNKKAPGTRDYMYDFDSRALRPREVTGGNLPGDYGCDDLIDNYLYLPNWQYPAVVDECVIESGDLSTSDKSGYSVIGGYLMDRLPYCTYFDFGKGIPDWDEDIHAVGPGGFDQGDPSSGNDAIGTWGWGDARWFGYQITKSNRVEWVDKSIDKVRSFNQGHGFLSVPSLLKIKLPELYGNSDLGINPTADGSYLMVDEQEVEDVVVNDWKPEVNISVSTDYISCIDFFVHHLFVVNNPDASTVYTWHVQDPDGNWLPFTYGTERWFAPLMTGDYTVYLRQDNLGGYGTNGVQTKTISVFLEQTTYCGLSLQDSINSEAISNLTIGFDRNEVDSYRLTDSGSTYDEYISEKQYYLNGNAIVPKILKANNILNSEPILTLYPNPTNSSVNIEHNLDCNNGVTMNISDVSGKVYENAKIENNQFNVDLTNYPPGIYLLHLISSSEKITEKLIKMRN